MKKTFLSVAVLYGIVALGSPYFVGNQMEKNALQFFGNAGLQQKLAADGVRLTLKHYDKGYFSSTADIHLSVGDKSGKLFYEGDFKADIRHAPLSVSGLNAADIRVNGAGKPTGGFGRYVPQDFITANAHQSLADLIGGNRKIHADIIFSALTTTVDDGDNLDFKGADAHLTASQNAIDFGRSKLQFGGLTISSANQNHHIDVKPFNVTGESSAASGRTIKLDALDITASEGGVEAFSMSLRDVTQNVAFMPSTDSRTPVPSAVSLKFKDWKMNNTQRGEIRKIQVKDGDFQFGFIPDGNNYALNIVAKAKPEFSDKVEVPMDLDNIDIHLRIAPFDRAYLDSKLPDMFHTVLDRPGMTADVIQAQLPGFLIGNAVRENVSADIDMVIEEKSAPVLAIKGGIREHIDAEADLMGIMFDPKTGIPKYFHGSEFNIFVSKQIIDEYLAYLARASALSGRPVPPTPVSLFLDTGGNLKVDLKVDDNQVLFNGKPAPF